MVCMPPQIARVGIWLRMASRIQVELQTEPFGDEESGIVEILRRGSGQDLGRFP